MYTLTEQLIMNKIFDCYVRVYSISLARHSNHLDMWPLLYSPQSVGKYTVMVRKQIFDCLLLYAMTHALVLEPIQMLLKYCIYTEHYLWIFKDASFNILVHVSK